MWLMAQDCWKIQLIEDFFVLLELTLGYFYTHFQLYICGSHAITRQIDLRG
jgi:hypothetical protein